jgi:hypothetical protein
MAIRFKFTLMYMLILGCAGKPYGKDAESNTESGRAPVEEASANELNVAPPAAVISQSDASQPDGIYEVHLKPGDDLPAIFRRLRDDGRVQRITFSPGEYVVSDTLHLPRTRSLLVIDGQGCRDKSQWQYSCVLQPSCKSGVKPWYTTKPAT